MVGCLFSLRGLFFAKLKFEFLEHSDQLKDDEATKISGGTYEYIT